VCTRQHCGESLALDEKEKKRKKKEKEIKYGE
jgi:hypothetical protein